jgi:hypothetical protein
MGQHGSSRCNDQEQELHVDLLQEVQFAEDVPANGFSTPLMPKTESFLSTSEDWHFMHKTCREPNTSISNSSPQALHRYS